MELCWYQSSPVASVVVDVAVKSSGWWGYDGMSSVHFISCWCLWYRSDILSSSHHAPPSSLGFASLHNLIICRYYVALHTRNATIKFSFFSLQVYWPPRSDRVSTRAFIREGHLDTYIAHAKLLLVLAYWSMTTWEKYNDLVVKTRLDCFHQWRTLLSVMLGSCWLSYTESWPLIACLPEARTDQLPGPKSVSLGQERLKTRLTPRSIRIDICDGAPCSPASRYYWPRRRQTSHPIHNEQQISNPWCFSSPLMRVWWCVPEISDSPSIERDSVHTSYCLLLFLLASPPRTLSANIH